MAILLVLTVLLPLLGSLVLFAIAAGSTTRPARSLALGIGAGDAGLSPGPARSRSSPDAAGPQFAFGADGGQLRPGVDGRGSGIRFALGLDGISLWLFVLTSLLMITAVFASWESVTERAPAHYALLLALADGPARALRQPRRGPLLHLLRVHPDPALLPDRPLRRPGAAAGVGHVLPLHAGRSLLTLLGRDRPGRRPLPAHAGARPDVLDPRADRRPGQLDWPSGRTPGATGAGSRSGRARRC